MRVLLAVTMWCVMSAMYGGNIYLTLFAVVMILMAEE